MSKKDKTTGEQNAPQILNPIVTLLTANIDLPATIAEGMFREGGQAPPTVYVQSDSRMVVVASDEDTARELCEKVIQTLASDYNVTALGEYGNPETTGKVWYDIDVTPKMK